MRAEKIKSRILSKDNLRGNDATVGYLVTSLLIARPEEIMVTGKLMQNFNLLFVSTSEKLVILKPFASS
jgi:hypothetical protein